MPCAVTVALLSWNVSEPMLPVNVVAELTLPFRLTVLTLPSTVNTVSIELPVSVASVPAPASIVIAVISLLPKSISPTSWATEIDCRSWSTVILSIVRPPVSRSSMTSADVASVLEKPLIVSVSDVLL